jgi:DNA-binding NarL/FixJ family response regulator
MDEHQPNTPETRVGIIVIEDDENTRNRLVQKLTELAGFHVIAACANMAQAQQALTANTPDILLVDLELPDGSGLDIISTQSDLHPDLPILVISVFGDEKSVIRAIEAGARGYLLKSDPSLAIEQCLKQLLEGGAPISATIARHLIRRLRPEAASKADTELPDQVNLLSERELEVLQLAAKGYSYQDIAELLGVKVSTVGSYTRRMYQKLSVHSRSEAVFEALRMGLVKRPEN